jgi:hypothetical protein
MFNARLQNKVNEVNVALPHDNGFLHWRLVYMLPVYRVSLNAMNMARRRYKYTNRD